MLKIVETNYGKIRGISGNNARVTAFKGIPFAAPPVGGNRWREPQPLKHFDGILDASRFAPISIQDTPGLCGDIYCDEWHVDPDIPMDEDCLYLNVWTCAESPLDKMPVLVWFFGGAFQWGYTSEMEFCGENIAKRGVVVVTVNYRLGVFGFFAHPELTKENPAAAANLGNLDQRAGLEWVRDNIEAFGGDPDNITIAGQSAGGASVLSHLVSDNSRGLFNRAVILSGIIRNPYEEDTFITPGPLEKMERLGERFLEFLGVKSLEEARALDALYIRDKYAKFCLDNPRFSPTIDGAFLKEEPYKAFINGACRDIPLIAGNTDSEFPYFTEDGHRVNYLEVAIKTLLNESDTDCYYYSFEADIPGADNPGTFHSVDLWFWFETIAASRRAFVGRHYDLARQMCNYLTNFVKCGNPNGDDPDGSPMPEWKPYDVNNRNEMHFTPEGCLGKVSEGKYKDDLIKILRIQNIEGRSEYTEELLKRVKFD